MSSVSGAPVMGCGVLIEQGVVVMSVKVICKMQDYNSAFAQNV